MHKSLGDRTRQVQGTRFIYFVKQLHNNLSLVRRLPQGSLFHKPVTCCKHSYLALYFSLSSSMIYRLLCLLPSAALFTLTMWPFGPPPRGSALRWKPLERSSEYWRLLLNLRKCEASFFSVDPYKANLRPNPLLLGSRLRFNYTPIFLGVTFDRLSFFF